MQVKTMLLFCHRFCLAHQPVPAPLNSAEELHYSAQGIHGGYQINIVEEKTHGQYTSAEHQYSAYCSKSWAPCSKFYLVDQTLRELVITSWCALTMHMHHGVVDKEYCDAHLYRSSLFVWLGTSALLSFLGTMFASAAASSNSCYSYFCC
jgi:hypothetical protein